MKKLVVKFIYRMVFAWKLAFKVLAEDIFPPATVISKEVKMILSVSEYRREYSAALSRLRSGKSKQEIVRVPDGTHMIITLSHLL